jgi:hypothetical protein
MGSFADAEFSWNSGSKGGTDSIILAADEKKERLGREA